MLRCIQRHSVRPEYLSSGRQCEATVERVLALRNTERTQISRAIKLPADCGRQTIVYVATVDK